jgi:7,8-dihydropterin-6-yl-methyl-4-(beta-D-ribofuranosyl)aminobenzene 5'-phosphate synthase
MIRHLTITQLVENTADARGLLGEHGVAWFIEADEHCLLFDTGQGQTLRHNAGRLAVSLERVEAIALSHGHYDHTGGLMDALAMTGAVDLYLHPAALEPKYDRDGRAIGTPFPDADTLRAHTRRLIMSSEPTRIAPGPEASATASRKPGARSTPPVAGSRPTTGQGASSGMPITMRFVANEITPYLAQERS